MGAYAAAHAGHVASIGQLSAVLASMSGTAGGSAIVLEETDLNNAAGLNATGLDG